MKKTNKKEINSYDEILKYSPHEHLRDVQLKALEDAYNIITKEPNKNFIVLELPPGVGKSAVGWMLAHIYKRGYFLTVRKQLQDQYVKEMEGRMPILKGKNAYICAEYPKNTCDNSRCLRDPKLVGKHSSKCPYIRAVHKALAASFCSFNMHSFYFQHRYGAFKGMTRDVLIIDEGHLIEETFMNVINTSIPLDGEFVQEIPRFKKTKDYIPFLKELYEKLSEYLDEYQGFEVSKIYIQAGALMRKIWVLLEDIKDNEWVHTIEERSERSREKIIFKPLFVDHFIQEFLYNTANEKTIIMSATIGDFDQFCQRSGIPKDQAIVIREGSPFPIKNRPIFRPYAGSMSKRNFKNTWPNFIAYVKELLEEHKDEKGIIHAHSEWLSSKIAKELNQKRITEKNGNVDEMLKIHGAKKNSVIVAAGLATGLDLKNDLSRFQIIAKVPYPNLGDVQMKRRFEISKNYYQYITALALMQSYGRSVRSKNDWAVTYIVDEDFDRFMMYNKRMLSDWFLEALQKD